MTTDHAYILNGTKFAAAALIFFFHPAQLFVLAAASRGIAVPRIVASGYLLPES